MKRFNSHRKNNKYNGLYHLLEYNLEDSRQRNDRKKFPHVKYSKALTLEREVSGWEKWRFIND